MIDPKTLYPLVHKRVLITAKYDYREIKAQLGFVRKNTITFTPLDGGMRATWPLERVFSIEPLPADIITTITPATLDRAIGKRIVVTYTKNNHTTSGHGRLQAVNEDQLYQLTLSGNSIRVIPLSMVLQVVVL